MPEFRRAYVPGGTFFFTVVTENRAPIFSSSTDRALLRRAFERTRSRWPFTVGAIVLLPEHLHTIWLLPEGDWDFSRRWSCLKRTFTTAWLLRGGHEQSRSESRRRNRRRGVWQRRFWEHAIRDERDFAQHCDYIHYSPVKHGLVECPHAWQHSSFQRFVRDKMYEPDWQCVCGGRVVKPPSFDTLAATAME